MNKILFPLYLYASCVLAHKFNDVEENILMTNIIFLFIYYNIWTQHREQILSVQSILPREVQLVRRGIEKWSTTLC